MWPLRKYGESAAKVHLEVTRHFCRQLFGVFCHLMVEVDGGAVLQKGVLPMKGLHELGMAMTQRYGHNSGKSIQVPSAVFVKKVLHFAFHDVQLPDGNTDGGGMRREASRKYPDSAVWESYHRRRSALVSVHSYLYAILKTRNMLLVGTGQGMGR